MKNYKIKQLMAYQYNKSVLINYLKEEGLQSVASCPSLFFWKTI